MAGLLTHQLGAAARDWRAAHAGVDERRAGSADGKLHWLVATGGFDNGYESTGQDRTGQDRRVEKCAEGRGEGVVGREKEAAQNANVPEGGATVQLNFEPQGGLEAQIASICQPRRWQGGRAIAGMGKTISGPGYP